MRTLLIDTDAGTLIVLPLKLKVNGCVLETRKIRLFSPFGLALPLVPTEISAYRPGAMT
ncbi:hypothetical protein [Limosilactobacillus reuteri]|uniref:hypothetical protein n=1 Tax=Limosilactobacillus reuteri TaxID=1598 RepID=UPI001CDC1D7F|nr:hypothetical protein [Limosilactobacillus reuteri]